MKRRSSLLTLVLLGLCFGQSAIAQTRELGQARGFPRGEFIREPDAALLNARSSSAVQGQADFERLAEFSRTDPLYKLSEKIAIVVLGGGPHCTAFLVGPDLVMTNHHCAFDEDNGNRQIPLNELFFAFDYYADPKVAVTVAPIALLEADQDLDFALYRVDAPIGERLGWLQLETESEAIRSAATVKIIQHPAGRPKEIARVNTDVLSNPDSTVMHYLADTEGGSSGSPVFDLRGEKVIALHHVGTRRYNEGISIAAILPRINAYLAAVPAAAPASRAPTPAPSPRPRTPEPPPSPADPAPPVAAPAAAATAAPAPPPRTCTLTDKLREVEGCR